MDGPPERLPHADAAPLDAPPKAQLYAPLKKARCAPAAGFILAFFARRLCAPIGAVSSTLPHSFNHD